VSLLYNQNMILKKDSKSFDLRSSKLGSQDEDLKILKTECEKMLELLNNGQPGLMSYWDFFFQDIKSLKAIIDHITDGG
jgi:hypothetical protein